MPNFKRTTDEMMIVSIVIPGDGIPRVVAIALAETDVKKNEKTSVRPVARRMCTAWAPACRRTSPRASTDDQDADELLHRKGVEVGTLAAALAAMERARGNAQRIRSRSAAT